MKTQAKLEQKRNLFSIIIGFLALVYISPVQAQIVRDHRDKGGEDPYTRLKVTAKKTVVNKSTMKAVKITVNNPIWKGKSKSKIKFVPFKLEDTNGKPIPSNRNITLKNGKTVSAQVYVDKMNEIEKKLNAQGFTLRNNSTQTVSRTYTRNEYLDGRRAKAPKSIGALKKGADLKKFMGLEKKVGIATSFDNKRGKTITLKPYSKYTESEKKEVNKYNFSKTSGGTIMAKKLIVPRRFQKFKIERLCNLLAIYEYKPTDNVANWSFGNPNTFQAAIEGRLHRYAKIYPFDPKNPEKDKSEFNVSARGKAKGALFGNSFDILDASCEFNAPSDITKKMNAKIQVKALGTTLFNKSTSYAQEASFNKIHGKSFDKSFPIEIPIIAGIDFKGVIGVKGEVGFEYKGEIQRTVASVQAKPIVNLEGYAEAGLEFADLLGSGVGIDLTFIKGELELNAHTGVMNKNSEQIVLGVTYYFGYDVEILGGEMYAYIEACVKYVRCYRPVEHKFFKWKGFKKSGTIAGAIDIIPIVNIAKYSEEPVMTGN